MPEMKDLPEEERERVWQDLSRDQPRPMVFANELTEAELVRLLRLGRSLRALNLPLGGFARESPGFSRGECQLEEGGDRLKQGVKKMLDEHMMPNMPMRGGSVKKGGKKGGKSGKRGC